MWQAVADPELHGKRQPDRGNMGQPHDTKAAHLQEPCQRPGGSSPSSIDKDLIIRDQNKTLGEQAQQQIGLPRTRRSQEQHTKPVPGGATCMKVHKAGYVVRFCSKWKHLVMRTGSARRSGCFT